MDIWKCNIGSMIQEYNIKFMVVGINTITII